MVLTQRSTISFDFILCRHPETAKAHQAHLPTSARPSRQQLHGAQRKQARRQAGRQGRPVMPPQAPRSVRPATRRRQLTHRRPRLPSCCQRPPGLHWPRPELQSRLPCSRRPAPAPLQPSAPQTFWRAAAVRRRPWIRSAAARCERPAVCGSSCWATGGRQLT